MSMTGIRVSIVGGLGLGLLVLASVAAGCSSSKSTPAPTAGTTGGAGGATGAAGSTTGGKAASAGSGGATTTGGAAATGGACAGPTGGTGTDPCADKPPCATPTSCTAIAPTNALITDWTDVGQCPEDMGTFVDGDHYSTKPTDNANAWWNHFFGGPYVYPSNPACSTSPLTQTISAHSWHVTGAIGNAAGDYAGFGLWLEPCMADFSAYGGISFTISGTTDSTRTLKVVVQTSSNSAHAASSCKSNVGTCVATDGGSCTDASVTVTLSDTATTVTLHWTDFTGGSPNASPNPAEITGIQFQPPAPYTYPWDNDAGTVVRTLSNPYNLNVTIGDITLVP
jgi:hypothetical protein